LKLRAAIEVFYFYTTTNKRRRIMENSEPRIVNCDIGPYPKDMFRPMPEVKATFNEREET
jgi:hypothetical protein